MLELRERQLVVLIRVIEREQFSTHRLECPVIIQTSFQLVDTPHHFQELFTIDKSAVVQIKCQKCKS